MRKLKRKPVGKPTSPISDPITERKILHAEKAETKSKSKPESKHKSIHKTLKKVTSKAPLRTIRRYKKQKCNFVTIDIDTKEPKQCNFFAVGKGTLCKKHGGDPVIKENLISIKDETLLPMHLSKFNPAVHPLQYINLSREGMSKVEIAASMEISVQVLKSWAERFESFNTASEIGDALHESWWIQRGKGGLDSRNFNTSLFKFLTSNKLGYSDKMETKNTNMNMHGVLLIPDAVTEDEWEKDAIDV
ncbi:MAG: hypothetical protein P9L97_05910 [Candidatus Tenebribacter davisii]|nr:hypothetical protein [Candidatus Tenebribacter davisii]